MKIEKAAVLGSGVMGSAIAAHLANAGIPSLMLDMVPAELSPAEAAAGLDKESPAFRNRMGTEALKTCLKAKPAPFYSKRLADMITIGNFEDDWDKIADADWVIEVVKEDLKIKRLVLAKAAEHRRPGSIITSNTSGISLAAMAEGLDDDFKKHFLGTHFFNPPRYLKLLELIPTADTDPALTCWLAGFVDRKLGKGALIARDTPNFVANRVGVFGMLDVIRAMEEMELTVEEVDSLTGPIVGRPRSASFRTADLVGLDTFLAVAGNVYDGCPDDEARELFQAPAIIAKMLEKGYLGEKSGGGFYRKAKDAAGKRIIQTLDLGTLEYRDKVKARFGELEAVKTIDNAADRVAAICAGKGKSADFTWRTLSHLFSYCAFRVGEICESPTTIDDGMKWGFAWESGPFEIWDAMGVHKTAARMREEGTKLPDWVAAMETAGADRFYKLEKGQVSVWQPEKGEYVAVASDPGKINLDHLRDAGDELKRKTDVSVMDLGDGIACIEFHSKMNTIGGDIIGTITNTMSEVEGNFDGVVIGNQGVNFSVGANLMLVLMEAMEGNWEDIDMMVRAFQRACMSMKYAARPVVVAPFGMTFGGGTEFTLHGQAVRASAETYIGLVEVGVGLIPAGGGCKEFYLRCLDNWTGTDDLLPPVRRAFETIGMAKVATSGLEAREIGFLRPSDGVSLNGDRLISDAKAMALGMYKSGFNAGRPRTDIPVGGSGALSALRVGIYNMKEAGFISEHDALIGERLAKVLCGGDLTGVQRVSEQYLLDLEREAFLSLLGERKTLERIQHMLKKNKPLRN